MGLATQMINVDIHPIISMKWNLRTQIHIKCLPNCTVKVSVSSSPQNGLSIASWYSILPQEFQWWKQEKEILSSLINHPRQLNV